MCDAFFVAREVRKSSLKKMGLKEGNVLNAV